MGRFLDTFRRIRTINLTRMRRYARLTAEESGMGLLRILADMCFCYPVYGIGYLDYRTFGFVYLDAARRRTFMTMNRNLSYVRQLNDADYRRFFSDKGEFQRRFSSFLGREVLDLRAATAEDFRRFLPGKTRLFAKQADAYGGKGIVRLEAPRFSDPDSLYSALLQDGQVIVEEAIRQHAALSSLSDSAVNSIRLVTLLQADKMPVLLYALIRLSDGVHYVDNISAGGMYCPIDANGVITADAYQDCSGEYYEAHPQTGTRFVGFRIPFFKEATLLVQKAASEVPEIRYVGWDVAITEDGPILIEGNVIPGYDMCQNYRHLGPEKVGILPRFEAVLQEGRAD